MAISENGVSFFGAGGHSHNGVNSTLIDTSSYSIFDFNTGYTGSQTRINRQSQNKTNLEDWIIRTINSRVLEPAGISLDPDTLNGKAIRANTITATQIAANTITANEIAANTITASQIAVGTITGTQIAPGAIGNTEISNVMSIIDLQSDFVTTNAVIRSTVYTPGSAGWQIAANGNAEFSNVTVRGTVVASNGSFGGVNIASNKVYAGAGSWASTNTPFYLDTNGYFSLEDKLYWNPDTNSLVIKGDITGSSGTFSGSLSGANITGATGTFSGTITANTGNIGNYVISSGSLTSTYSATLVPGYVDVSSTITLDTATKIQTTTYYRRYDLDRGYLNQITFNNANDVSGGIIVQQDIYNSSFTSFISTNQYSYLSTGAFDTSDMRLKDIIDENIDGLNLINSLQVKKFTLKKDNIKAEKVGFIAQELYEVLPNAVIVGGEDPDTESWKIKLDPIIPYLTKAVQEIYEELNSVKTRLQALEGV